MEGQITRILIRGVNWLGDAVMTTPALQRLREALPTAEITLLTHEKLADLWQDHPSINSVLTFATSENVWSIARKLRRHNFDSALVLPNSPRSALEVWLARIPKRVGYARPWRNFFLNKIVAARADRVKMRKRSVAEINQSIGGKEKGTRKNSYSTSAHQIHEYLQLVAAFGASTAPLAPSVHVTPTELESAARRFALRANGQQIYFGLNPGAEYGPAKRWPLARFISAAAKIQKQTGCQWLIFGGQGDLGIAAEIEKGLQHAFEKDSVAPAPPLNLAGKTTLRELCILLKLCRVVLTNDSGPMHIAAAVGTPVVVPFGSTSPELTGPGLPGEERHRLLTANAPCSPCFLRECPIDFRCMTGISVERIVDAVLQASAVR